jgi:hypothetical protein
VLKEALRRYSVVPVVTRSLKEDDVLGGHTVPAGSMVVCHIQVCWRTTCLSSCDIDRKTSQEVVCGVSIQGMPSVPNGVCVVGNI